MTGLDVVSFFAAASEDGYGEAVTQSIRRCIRSGSSTRAGAR
jgi:hypothetical protein